MNTLRDARAIGTPRCIAAIGLAAFSASVGAAAQRLERRLGWAPGQTDASPPRFSRRRTASTPPTGSSAGR